MATTVSNNNQISDLRRGSRAGRGCGLWAGAGLSAARANGGHDHAGRPLCFEPGRRRRRDAGRHAVPELMQTDAFELMRQGPELPRARREPGLPGAGRTAPGDGRADGQSQGVQRTGGESRMPSPALPRPRRMLASLAPQAHQASAQLMERRSPAIRRRWQALASQPEALAADGSQRLGLRQSRVQRQRLPRRRFQGRGRCAHGAQRRGLPAARRRQCGDEGDRRRSAGVQRACCQCRGVQGARRPAAGACGRPSRAPPPPLNSCNRPASRMRPCRRIAANGAALQRCSPASRRRCRRSPSHSKAFAALAGASAGAGRDPGQRLRLQPASRTTPMRSAMPRRKRPPMRAWRATPRRSSSLPRQCGDEGACAPIRACFRRSSSNAVAFAGLASNAHMMSPQVMAAIGRTPRPSPTWPAMPPS